MHIGISRDRVAKRTQLYHRWREHPKTNFEMDDHEKGKRNHVWGHPFWLSREHYVLIKNLQMNNLLNAKDKEALQIRDYLACIEHSEVLQ